MASRFSITHTGKAPYEISWQNSFLFSYYIIVLEYQNRIWILSYTQGNTKNGMTVESKMQGNCKPRGAPSDYEGRLFLNICLLSLALSLAVSLFLSLKVLMDQLPDLAHLKKLPPLTASDIFLLTMGGLGG